MYEICGTLNHTVLLVTKLVYMHVLHATCHEHLPKQWPQLPDIAVKRKAVWLLSDKGMKFMAFLVACYSKSSPELLCNMMPTDNS